MSKKTSMFEVKEGAASKQLKKINHTASSTMKKMMKKK
jgi:hypothetical protein